MTSTAKELSRRNVVRVLSGGKDEDRFHLLDRPPVHPKRYTVTVGPAGGIHIEHRGPR